MEIIIFVIFLAIFFADEIKQFLKINLMPSAKSEKQILVDTSILIDGRFLAVAKTGFVNFRILIPRSVVGELQTLADGGDDEKRSRARYGLDIISALQNVKNLTVEILHDGEIASEGVDNRLLRLAKDKACAILTADYNLNKVAKVEGIEVLNINELVQSVRASYLPGEKLMLEILQKGNEKKQGVGHLPDGTMVVVENGESLIGTTCEVEFIRALQTAAGKMMFARPVVVKNQKAETAKSKGRAPVSTASSSKKPAQKPAKDSLKNQKSPPRKQPKSPKHRRTQKSAEASLVELANQE